VTYVAVVDLLGKNVNTINVNIQPALDATKGARVVLSAERTNCTFLSHDQNTGRTHFNRSRGSSVSIVSDCGLDDRAIAVRSPAGAKDFFSLTSVSRPALRPTQPPVQWVPGFYSPGQSAAGA
jgi:hypothetical protein